MSPTIYYRTSDDSGKGLVEITTGSLACWDSDHPKNSRQESSSLASWQSRSRSQTQALLMHVPSRHRYSLSVHLLAAGTEKNTLLIHTGMTNSPQQCSFKPMYAHTHTHTLHAHTHKHPQQPIASRWWDWQTGNTQSLDSWWNRTNWSAVSKHY